MMKGKRQSTGLVWNIIMAAITSVSLVSTGVFGALYYRERQEVQAVMSENVVLRETQAQEVIFQETGVITNEKMEQLLAQKESEVEESLKEKIKELVTAKDGTPLKMLRQFFPENLIYYDGENYVFAPVLNNVKKHNLKDQNFRENEAGEMEYVENGTVVSHKGIDVSKYQEKINWEKVKADGVEYAFIRLGLRGYGSGKLVMDEYYDQNMREASAAGVETGVYFFTQAVTVEEAVEEANYVIENLTDYEVTYPIVFDVEMIVGDDGRANDLSQELRTDICIAFCDTIQAAGYTPMIYGNIRCFTQMLDMSRLEAYEKWYAFYDDYMYMPYEVSVWQYSESGSVDGIKGKVDMNISYKTW